MSRDLVSDEGWAFFERFILSARAPNGRKPANHRLVLDGIFWVARTGAPWRDLPEEFGKWSSVYRRFRRWTLAGLREEIMGARNESGAVPDALQMIDSTVIRGHHQEAGAKGGLPDRVSGAQEVALPLPVRRSRSDLPRGTRIHLVVNAHGLPMRTEIPPGQTSDYPGPGVLLADRGCDGDCIRADLIARNVLPVIPMRKSRKKRIGVGRPLYRLRNLVERGFNKPKNARRVATRYDKTAESFPGFIDITSIRLWRRHLST